MTESTLCIDLGATNLRVGVIGPDLKIRSVSREKSLHNDKNALRDQIVRMVRNEIGKSGPIGKIGVSACGIVEDGTIVRAANLGISDFPLKTILSETFRLPVFLMNDAAATALSEALFGAGKDLNVLYFATISSGIGGALVVEKKAVDLPFELGQHLFFHHGALYRYEELLSGNGLIRLAAMHGLEAENAASFFALVEKKEAKATDVLDVYTSLLAEMFYNIQADYATDGVILSGGVLKSASLFIDELKRKTDALTEKYALKNVLFRFAQFDQDAGLFGGYASANRL